jgi:hypothetical protein
VQVFITALAVGAFLAVARIADRLLVVLLVAAIAVFAWRATTGGVPAVEMQSHQFVSLIMEYRQVAVGAILGMVVGRPLALLVRPTTTTLEV